MFQNGFGSMYTVVCNRTCLSNHRGFVRRFLRVGCRGATALSGPGTWAVVDPSQSQQLGMSQDSLSTTRGEPPTGHGVYALQLGAELKNSPTISVSSRVLAHEGVKIFCLMGFAAIAGDWAGVCVSIYLIGLIVPELFSFRCFLGHVTIVPKRLAAERRWLRC